jgi:hypothetical protein
VVACMAHLQAGDHPLACIFPLTAASSCTPAADKLGVQSGMEFVAARQAMEELLAAGHPRCQIILGGRLS